MTSRYLRKRRLSTVMIALTIASLLTTMVEANDRIDLIVPLGKGGALDRFARTAEQFLGNGTDLEISVQNFPPKGGEDGYREFLIRPADGSTILAWFEPAAAAYRPNVSLDDLAIINVQEIEPPILAARSDLGWSNLGEMIAALRRTPNQHRFGYGRSSPSAAGNLLASGIL